MHTGIYSKLMSEKPHQRVSLIKASYKSFCLGLVPSAAFSLDISKCKAKVL